MSRPDAARDADDPATGRAVDLDPVWRALGDPTRRAILDELRDGPKNTSALCATFERLGRHGVIKHLKTLERAGLVRVEARGRERINHLDVVPIQQIYQRWIRPYEAFWASHLQRLASEITTDEGGEGGEGDQVSDRAAP